MKITDGTKTTPIPRGMTISGAVNLYVQEYKLNGVEEVDCRVVNDDGETLRTFTIISENGHDVARWYDHA